jgi:hypothetical protein
MRGGVLKCEMGSECEMGSCETCEMAVRRVRDGILWDLVRWRCWQRLVKWNVKRCSGREGGLRNARRGLCEMVLERLRPACQCSARLCCLGVFFCVLFFVVLIGSGESRVWGVCRA